MTQDSYEHWWHVEEIFALALDLPSEERAAFLDEACRSDAALRVEVEDLLGTQEAAAGFLDDPAAWFDAPLLPGLGVEENEAEEVAALDGQHIGAYRLLKRIGYGGMGTVYLAERADGQFRQRVALKLLRRGMHTDETVRRFRLERQILAGLQHPNIALLLDGGVTADGLPYLVMQYVAGEPIDCYCDRKRLSIEARLWLFLTVCEAVQYAHQNLVVHRDLKPSNILMTEEGQAKLLDFGIAKVLDEAKVVFPTAPVTESGLRLMTPEYASPEQVRGEAITTASDVYALGVLLYELLTGHRPYRLPSHMQQEVERIICEEEPQRPSAAVSEVGERTHINGSTVTITPEEVSETRDTRVERLRRRLAGDLDNIVLKALRKESARRYTSAEQFSEDIRRHLEGLPVKARPDTPGYRVQKFVRRHRVAVAAAGLVLMALLLGLAGTMWQAHVAAEERDRARLEAVKATQVAEYLMTIFEESDLGVDQDDTSLTHYLFDLGLVEAELATSPEVRTHILDVGGRLYQSLGFYGQAASLFEEALAMRQKRLGDEHPDVATSLNNLALLLKARGGYDEAEVLYREALAMRRKLLGDEHPDVATSLNNLALLLKARGGYDEAEVLHREALAMRKKLLGEEHRKVAISMQHLARALWNRGNYEAAESLYRQALAMQRRWSNGKPLDLFNGLTGLADLFRKRGDLDEAESLLREALRINRLGANASSPSFFPSPRLDMQIASMRALADLLRENGDLDEAESLLREAVEIDRKHPKSAPQSDTPRQDMADLLCEKGDIDEAASLYREEMEIWRKVGRDVHVAYVTMSLGACLVAMERFQEAEPLLFEAFSVLHEANGSRDPVTQEAQTALNDLYTAWGKPEQAAAFQRKKAPLLFVLSDLDQDGFIEQANFHWFLEATAIAKGWAPNSLHYTELQSKLRARWDRLREAADPNRDEKVSLDEWLAYAKEVSNSEEAYKAEMEGIVASIFALYDHEDEGQLEYYEWKKMYEEMRMLPYRRFAVLVTDSMDLATDSIAVDLYRRLGKSDTETISKGEMAELLDQFFKSEDPEALGNRIFDH